MKNQWFIWLFVAGVVIVVLFALNYQGGNEMPLSEEQTQRIIGIAMDLAREGNWQSGRAALTQRKLVHVRQ